MKVSNKSLLGVRGNGKPVTSFLKQIGQRNGKTLAGAMLETAAEMQVNPPATAEEAKAFCRIQIKRCTVNLANAKDRRDKRAIANLERKLAVYQFLHRMVKNCTPPPPAEPEPQLTDPPEDYMECPNCMTWSTIRTGIAPVVAPSGFEVSP